jgi:hypothetical protein
MVVVHGFVINAVVVVVAAVAAVVAVALVAAVAAVVVVAVVRESVRMTMMDVLIFDRY